MLAEKGIGKSLIYFLSFMSCFACTQSFNIETSIYEYGWMDVFKEMKTMQENLIHYAIPFLNFNLDFNQMFDRIFFNIFPVK